MVSRVDAVPGDRSLGNLAPRSTERGASCRYLNTCAAPAILPVIQGGVMASTSQRRAIDKYRTRLAQKGIARFEVIGLERDRDLIRTLAKHLAHKGPDAEKLRAEVGRSVSGQPLGKGGILAALRRSPLVGADLVIARPIEHGRKVDL